MPGLTCSRTSSALPLLALLACGPGSGTTDKSTDAATDTDPTGEPPTSTAPTGDTGDVCPSDGSLPPEGSPCSPDGAGCSPAAEPCESRDVASCVAGVWQYVQVGPDPSCGGSDGGGDGCDPLPSEGQACSSEGASCGSDCSNVCEFCNILTCQSGSWQNTEVLPFPCLDCDEICGLTVVPMCPGGPPDEATCISGCMDALAGPCEAEFSELLACAGTTPTFTCGADTRPLIAGCESEFNSYYACAGL